MKKIEAIIKYAPAMWEIIFAVCFVLASSLIVASFILPPKGVIDPSVLKAAGELLAFPTIYSACKCVMTGLGVKITKGDTTVEVKGNKENSETDE